MGPAKARERASWPVNPCRTPRVYKAGVRLAEELAFGTKDREIFAGKTQFFRGTDLEHS